MGFIYLITNKINNKKYIGQTVNSINTRWIQHKSEAKRGVPDVYFIRALRKYGVENFTVEQLEECNDQDLNYREQYYIKLYDTFNPEKGYNSTIGGNCNNIKYDRKKILKLWNNGYTVNEIAKQMGSCSSTISLILHEKNITISEIKKRAAKKHGEDVKKKIYQYDLNGNLINIFSCVQEASKKTGVSESSIRSVCNHHRYKSNGYIWCHEEDAPFILQYIKSIPLEKTKHPIIQYDLNGNFIKIFNSCREAADELNIHRASIEAALKNKNYHSGGYLWKYIDDDEDINNKVERNKNKKNYQKKKINQYDLYGNFIMSHSSARDASLFIGKEQGSSSIIKACRGKLKTAYGYKWSYAKE